MHNPAALQFDLFFSRTQFSSEKNKQIVLHGYLQKGPFAIIALIESFMAI
jgi:hypothetical protein